MNRREPIAWMVYTVDGQSAYVTDNPSNLKEGQSAYALYPWPFEQLLLTDEEIRKYADKHLRYQPESYEASGVFDLVRAIEKYWEGWPEQLERFAALVAAAEREACAKLCDDKAKETFSGQCQVWGDHFARVIRARWNT